MIHARVSLAASILLLSSTVAWADEAGEKAVRNYIAALDASPSWASSAKSIRSDGDKIVVENWTASLESGGLKKTTGIVTLEGVVPGDKGGLKAKSIAARDIKVESSAASVTIPQASASDIAIPLPPKVALDPKKIFSSIAAYYRLAADLNFGEISIPVLTMTQQIDLPKQSGTGKITSNATYSGLKLSHAQAGHIERIALDAMTAETVLPEAQGGDWKLNYTGVETRDLDIAAIAHVLDPAEYANGKGDGQWRDAVRSSVINKVDAFLQGKSVFSSGPIEFKGLRMRQTQHPMAEVIDRLLSSPPPDETKAMAFLTEDMPSLIGFYAFDSFTASALKGGDPATAQFALDRLSVMGFTGDGLQRVALEGLSGGGPEFGGTMKLFAIEGIEWPKMSALINYGKFVISRSGGAVGDATQSDAYADSFLNFYPKYARIVIDGVSGGPPNREPVRMGHYETSISSYLGTLPASHKSAIDSITVPGWVLRLDPQSAQFFDALGYDKLDIALNSQSTVDSGSGDARGQSTFKVASAGTLLLDLAFGGITEANVRAAMIPFLTVANGNPEMAQMLAAVAPFSFDGLTLRFDDASLTKRLLSFAAKMQGTDVPTLIANSAAMAQLGLAELKNPTFTEQVVTAVKAFLTDPKSLTIEVKPAHPVKASQLMALDPQNPGAAIDLLGVKIRAND